MDLVLQMPAPYPLLRAALDDDARDVAVLAAPCAGARGAFLAWLLARTAGRPGRRSVWASARPVRDAARLREWLERSAEGWWSERRLEFELAGGRLLVTGETEYDRLPLHRVDDLVLMDADLLPDPQAWAAQCVDGLARYVGAFPSAGSWLSRWEGPTHRITAADAVAAGHADPQRLARVREVTPSDEYDLRWEGRRAAARAEVAARFNVFARTRLKIRTKEGEIVPFRLRSVQRTYAAIKAVESRRARAEGRPPRFLLLKYRRGGFTTLEQGQSYQMCATRPNMAAMTLAHKRESTVEIFRIAQLMHQRDPHAPRTKSAGNAKKLEFPDLNSVFTVGTAGGKGEGRGGTYQRVHGSEVSKWGAGAARLQQVQDLVVGLTEAASSGEVVLETTPNGHEWFYETYREAQRRQNSWTPVFIPWFFDPTNVMARGTFSVEELRDTLGDDEKFLLEQHRLTLGQIAWRRRKQAETKGLFKQEYPENDADCFLTAGLCFFDASTVLDLIEVLPPYETDPIPSGYEVVWEEPIEGVQYCIGADTSEGVKGSDPNGLGVLRMDTGAQAAAVHGVFTPAELAAHCFRYGKKYGDALLAIERNNHGHAVIGKLASWDSGTYYHNLYIHDDGKIGWPTTPGTRPVMLSDVKEAVEDGHMKVRDRELLQECLLFVKQRSGKYAGTPDDAVMKWAVAWQAYQRRPVKSDVI